MKFRSVTILFFAALAAEIVAIATGSEVLEYLAKPSLMPILIYYLAINTTGPAELRRPMLLALVFSWLGDLFLLSDKYNGGMFVWGLAAFLTAHAAYIYFFLRLRSSAGITGRPGIIALAAIVFYSSALFMFLLPFVPEALSVPVTIYTLALTAMLISSVAAFRGLGSPAARLCIAGAAIFVVSDSILAINRFAIPFGLAPILVMATYGTAQFLITEGARKILTAR